MTNVCKLIINNTNDDENEDEDEDENDEDDEEDDDDDDDNVNDDNDADNKKATTEMTMTPACNQHGQHCPCHHRRQRQERELFQTEATYNGQQL